MKAYAPVSGNWCWISADKPVLRYALNHGWRFAIILLTICLYIYLYSYFRSELKEIANLRRPSQTPVSFPGNDMENESSDDEFEMRNKETGFKPWTQDDDMVPISSSKALTNITSYQQYISSSSVVTPFSYNHTASVQSKQQEIQKVLLLNAYPIAYVILWLPGIINRIVELSGTQSRTLQILQSASQFVGLANAVTYGYNEGIKRQMATWWEKKHGGPPSSSSARGMV